jgi:hypothetical protein
MRRSRYLEAGSDSDVNKEGLCSTPNSEPLHRSIMRRDTVSRALPNVAGEQSRPGQNVAV